MDMNVGDSLNSEELLKNTLHCDDKEKLRRKLAQLQKEYLKTAQRLQRAERLEAVQKHIRCKLQDQKEPQVPCSSSSLTTNQNNSTVQDFDTLRRNQVFTLPSDATGPQTPELRGDAARGRRPSPTLRLRSRRSRLRLERRSTAEGGGSNDSSQQGSGEGMGSVKSGEEQGMIESKADAVNESEELFSNTESKSPSLLLPHWNAQGHSETGNILGKEHQRDHQEGKETNLNVKGNGGKPILISEGRELLVTQAGDTEIKTGDDRSSCNELGKYLVEENRSESCEKNEGGVIKSETNPKSSLETKEERNGLRREEKTASLLDSCTLVEGLLFPAEYYIRTTRRMTVSQSQPDVQLIVLSQLNSRRQRRSRGRGRGRNRHSHSGESSDQHTRTDFCSPETLSSFIDPLSSPHAPAECGQSSSDVSDPVTASQMDPESSFSPTVTTVRPLQGKRRGRGRGRRRPRTPRSHQHIGEQTSADPQPSDIKIASSQSNGGVKTCFSSVEADPEPAGTKFLSNIHGAPTSCSGHHLEKVFPIFVKSSRPPQMNKGTPNWESLLLPSSSSPARSSLLSPLSPFPISLVSALKSLDIHQDFHLPDDQFASLKLHKLRRVAVESGVEHFSTPSRNTRSSIRRSHPECSISDPSVMLPLPLSLTPTVLSSPRPDDTQLLHIQDLSVEQVLANESISKNSVHELLEKNVAETDKEQQLCAETLDKSTKSVLVVEEETEGDAKEDRPSEVHMCGRDQSEHRDDADSAYSDYCPKETQEKPSNIRFPLESHKETKAPQESPASEKYHFISPHLPSPTPASSPALPSLGITPRPAAGGPPLSPSPFAPPLSLPPPYSPSTPALSPPALPLFPSTTSLSLSPSLPPLSPCRQIQDLSVPPAEHDQVIEPAAHPTPSSVQRHESGEQETNRSAGEHGMRCTHTLKAAAGGSLVDVCCFPGSSDGLYVAAAGAWAVCLWSWTPLSDWSLKHTWTFSKPVISVFPVQDAAELVCVTLGQLEIREVRLLLCSSLTQMLICDGVMQVVVGVYKSRVVTSSHAASGSTLQVFTLSDSVSSWSSQPLVSPGVCVSALAPVDGLSDALIGSDEGGHIFIWNLNSGQLLSRVLLSHDLSQTSCLRGYAHCGVLFVLLQHQFLSSLNDEKKEATIEDQRFLMEDTRTAMFSLVGINPLNGKSILATRLYPPEAWSGRLCEADVFHSSVVGLSQSGSACVWELGKCGTSRMLEAPEGEDWQLARWGGGGDMLVMGHHNGDVSVHQCW